MSRKLLLAASAVAILSTSPSFAASDEEMIAIRNEIKQMQESYEKRIAVLEKTLTRMENKKKTEAPPKKERSIFSANEHNDAPKLIYGDNHSEGPTLAVGANIDMVASARDFGDKSEEKRLSLREVEVSLESQITPNLYGFVFMTRPEGESFTVEEAAVVADLPLGFRLKAGDYRNEFGLLNTVHEPERPQISIPLPIEEFLGEEQLREASVTLGKSFPVGDRKRAGVSVAVMNADNQVAFNEGESGDKAYAGKLYYGDKSDRTAYQLGLSALNGKNDAEGNLTTNLQAVDFSFFVDPDYNEEMDYPARFALSGEALFNQRELASGVTNNANGYWALADYQFMPGHHVGIGGEYSQNLLDRNIESKAYSSHYTWYYSPHARVQVEGRQVDPDNGDNGFELMAQWNIVLFPHSEKSFLDMLF
tara:strand:- start:180 stop:1442 length:1263 start_codon:yes stop_codon:yes gene_type:complete